MLSQVSQTVSPSSDNDDRGSGRRVPSIAIVESNSRRPSVAVLTSASGREYRVSID